MRKRDLLTLGLTASAAKAEAKAGARPVGRIPGVGGDWQRLAWDYLHSVGELGYASKFYERPMSKLFLEPEYEVKPGVNFSLSDLQLLATGGQKALPDGVTPDMLPDAAELTRVADAWDAFQDKGGGRDELQARYGKLDFVNGEMYLACLYDDDAAEPYWTIKSKFELRPSGERDNEWIWLRGPSDRSGAKLTEPEDTGNGLAVVGPGNVMAYRVWRPDGQYAEQADAPMRGIIERAEDLIVAARSIRATGRSRIARSGILYLNERLLSGMARPQPGQPHPFLQELGQHMMMPLGKDGDASEVVPYLLTGNLPANEAMSRVTFTEREGYPELPLITELLRRVALSLDMPMEFLTGIALANHWTGWLLTDEAWSHVEPVCKRMCSDFTTVYLRPVLRAGNINAWRQWSVGFDNSAVVVNPDRGKDADQAHDRGAISDRAYREAKGFKEDDAPTDDSPNSNPRVIAAESGTTPADGADGGGAQDQVPPDDTATRNEIRAAADVALARCRELAGSRIRSRLRGAGAYDRFAHVPLHRLAAEVGEEQVHVHLNGNGDATTLTAGGSACFAAALEGRAPAATIGHLRAVIETWAAQTLYQRDPGRVPV